MYSDSFSEDYMERVPSYSDFVSDEDSDQKDPGQKTSDGIGVCLGVEWQNMTLV